MNRDATRSDASGDDGGIPDAELARVLDAFLADVEAGRPADPDCLLLKHPSLAERLRTYLPLLGLAHQLDASSADDRTGLIGLTPRGSVGSIALSAREADEHGTVSNLSVLLPDPPGDGDEPVVTRLNESRKTLGRYQLLGEIARGGMGVVFKARDAHLGRDLAVKVLHDRHRGEPDFADRFVEEAQIGGQLQHPGIVPVFELGAESEGRPFLAMKLVRGRTLAALLAERASPATDLPRFLTIFEQVAQTVAYAHARGVIHRDLKPSNVMVGSFGEVQVMDWGLAKVLAAGGVADERRASEARVRTVRSGEGSDGSQAGSVLGTPAYMAPEQARGAVESLDERVDVFGLGALLCEILTGRPPYDGRNPADIRAAAARADLVVAAERIASCGADDELQSLARSCLAAEPSDRPRNAGEVAREVASYRSGVQDRLRAAELARVEAQAKAVEEKKRRRLALCLAAALIVLILTIGGGGAWWAYDRLARAARVDVALRGAEVLRDEAERAADDPSRWAAAREAANHLGPLLTEARDAPTRQRAASLIQAVNRGAAAAVADRVLLDEITAITANGGDGSIEEFDARFAEAFNAWGINPDVMSPAVAGRMIAGRPPRVTMALAYGLDFWAEARRRLEDRTGAERVTAVARQADPDPWRGELRTAVGLRDPISRRDALRRLARENAIDTPAFSAMLLGMNLFEAGDATEAERVLRPARDREPGDLWLNVYLARSVQQLGRPDEAIRYFTAAQAAQPHYAWELGLALEQKGETDRAIDVFRELTRKLPDHVGHYIWLGEALRSQGQTREANDAFDAGIAASRRRIGRKPNSPDSHNWSGSILLAKGSIDEAIAEYREAIRLNPDSSKAHFKLGFALRVRGDTQGAIAEYREAVHLQPDNSPARINLGIALGDRGDADGAIAELREAVRLQPESSQAHYNLAVLLNSRGDRDGAIAEYREAIRLNPDHALAYGNLGIVLDARGDVDAAIEAWRQARDRAGSNVDLRRKVESRLAGVERRKRLSGRLPAILRGEDRPRDANESLDLASLCLIKKLYAAAARLFGEAFTSDPKLVVDRQSQHRYNAACAAALAAAGRGEDDPRPDDQTRMKLRRKALDWLRDERSAWADILQTGSPKVRQAVAKVFHHWQVDTDLADVRDKITLAKLTDTERTQWELFWSDVSDLLAKAEGAAEPRSGR